jgi:hypothetical protein
MNGTAAGETKLHVRPEHHEAPQYYFKYIDLVRPAQWEYVQRDPT